MPSYEHYCSHCDMLHEFFRPMSECSRDEVCPNCSSITERRFSSQRRKEFQEYYDEQYQTTISSYGQEKKLMKQHGHIPVQETPQMNKFKEDIRRKRKKPIYFHSK